MNASKLLGFFRRLTWVLALVGGVYIWNRYEVMSFPTEGCSPVLSLRPGSVLWIDRKAEAASAGDVLFFRLPSGQAALGRCSKRRESPPGFWIVADNPECPGQDSESLGWLEPRDLEGRLLMAF